MKKAYLPVQKMIETRRTLAITIQFKSPGGWTKAPSFDVWGLYGEERLPAAFITQITLLPLQELV